MADLDAPPPAAAPVAAAVEEEAAVANRVDDDDEEHLELEAAVVPAAPAGPQEEWDVWFDSRLPRGLTQEEYRSRLKNVGTVRSVADLDGEAVAYYNAFQFVPEAEANKTRASRVGDPFRFNLRLFRTGVAPFWEDQPDESGIHTLRFPSDIAPVNYQLFWKALTRSVFTGRVLNCDELVDEDTCAAGAPFDTSNMAGVCVHYGRNKGFGQIEVWCRHGGPAAEQLMAAVTQIIPRDKYRYELTSAARDAMVRGNAYVRSVAGKPTLKAANPPSFTISDSIERPLFKPYEKKTAGTVKRAFDRPARVAGAARGLPPKVERVKVESNKAEKSA